MPRVLAIVSSHIGAGALVSSALAAQYVLVSNPQISLPIGGGRATQVTDLKSSAFLRGDPVTGEITAQRQTISAVLLISVAGDGSSVLGILHPDAHYPLNINAFPEIPFIKIQRWPIENGKIQTEWVLGISAAFRGTMNKIGDACSSSRAFSYIAVAAIPFLPTIVLEPGLALAIFVTPALFDAAYDTAPRDLRKHWLPSSILAVAAVIVTTQLAVGTVAHFMEHLGWAAAFTLGAIVSPPDA